MIRQAQESDFDAVTRIYENLVLDVNRLADDKDYRLQVQQSGFLLSGEVNYDEFKEEASRYSVFEQEGKVVGYIRIDEDPETAPEEFSWIGQDLKEQYFSPEPRANVSRIGVLSVAKQRGIATALLQNAERPLRDKNILNLFSFVVFSPITNIPSMMFHEKHGFERVAVMDPCFLYGMNGYQALMYRKNLS